MIAISDTTVSEWPLAIITLGQDPIEELKTQQQMVAEIKKLRNENAAQRMQIGALQSTVAIQDAKIELYKERGDFFKDAATKGLKVGDNSLLLEAKYQQEINDFKQENQRLRWENDKLRSSRNKAALIGGIIGAGITGALMR